MATIRDVAKRASVSIATVSATINGTSPVSEKTRERVLEAIKAVGYVSNPVARSLRRGTSQLIGIVLSDIGNPFDATVVRTIEDGAIAAGYSCIICNSHGDPERELRTIDQLIGHQVAGIILLSVGRAPDHAQRIRERNLPPIVTIDQWVNGLGSDYVGVDNRIAVRMLTEYLLRLGHRRIAMITGDQVWTSHERREGFIEAMGNAGLGVDPDLCVPGNYRSEDSYRAAATLMTRENRPTAIIGANNIMALGALQSVLDLGFDCPGDVSIAGIDDVPWGNLVRPRITTVVQPVEDMASTAIDWLLDRIGNSEAPEPRDKRFNPALITGDSCRAIDPN